MSMTSKMIFLDQRTLSDLLTKKRMQLKEINRLTQLYYTLSRRIDRLRSQDFRMRVLALGRRRDRLVLQHEKTDAEIDKISNRLLASLSDYE